MEHTLRTIKEYLKKTQTIHPHRSAVFVKQSTATAKLVIRQQNNTNNKNYNRQLLLPTQQTIPRETYSIIGAVRQPASQLVS